MARVYFARHTFLDRSYAVKIQTTKTLSAAKERFEREARIISRIEHPNVVSVHDFGVTPDGLPYLVMEWIEGFTLGAAMREAPFPASRAASIAKQIASALSALHQLGFIHRDLKPGNVMLAELEEPPYERVKLLDFGLARPAEDRAEKLTQAGQILGTPHYIAPEVMAGQSVPDVRADLYALGVVLYAMLGGDRPFQGKTPGEILRSQLRDTPQPLPLAGGLEKLALQLIEPDPNLRPQTADEVIRRIESLQIEPWIGVKPAPRLPPPASTAPYPVSSEEALTTEPGAPPTASMPVQEETFVPTELTRTEPMAPRPANTAVLPMMSQPAALAVRRSPAGWLIAGVSTIAGAVLIAAFGMLGDREAPVVAKSAEVRAIPPPSAAAASSPASSAPRFEEPAAPPEPVVEKTKARPSKQRTPVPEPQITTFRADLDRELRARRWPVNELKRVEALGPLVAKLEGAPDEKDREAAARVILDQLDTADREGRLIRLQLERISAKLTKSRGKIPAATLHGWETRYFDLAQRPRTALPAAEYRGLVQQTASLEKEIDSAGR